MFSEKSIELSKNPTVEEIVNGTYKFLSEEWFVGYDYRKSEPTIFKSKELINVSSENFYPILNYGYKLASFYLYDYKLPKLATEEIVRAENEGSVCMYVSTLVYYLMKLNGFNKELNYVQGFFKFDLREDFPSYIPMGKIQTGLHSFLEYDGSVIDLSIVPQQNGFFDFKDKPIIVGNIPDGLELIGFRESEDTLMKYAMKFADESKMDVIDWVLQHNVDAMSVAVEAVKTMVREKRSE